MEGGALQFFISNQGECLHTSTVLWEPRRALWAAAEREGETGQSPFLVFFPKHPPLLGTLSRESNRDGVWWLSGLSPGGEISILFIPLINST